MPVNNLGHEKGTIMNKCIESRHHTILQRSNRSMLIGAAVIVMALALGCSRAPENLTTANNDPDQLLRQMSEKLSHAKNLSFKVDRMLDAALVEGLNVPENAQIEISVSRPGKF